MVGKLLQKFFARKGMSHMDYMKKCDKANAQKETEEEIRRRIREELVKEEERRRDIEEQCQKIHEERVRDMYPTKIELSHCIDNGVSKQKYGNPRTLINANDSVHLELTIKSSLYEKEKVALAVKEICQKTAEYFY